MKKNNIEDLLKGRTREEVRRLLKNSPVTKARAKIALREALSKWHLEFLPNENKKKGKK